MKILVINGSPKGDNSDTIKLTNAFLEGMGEQAEIIDSMKVDVGYCRGCFGCWHKTPTHCVLNDDMRSILEKIKAADLVIWSMPLYCYGMPANCKVIVDRLLPLSSPVQYVDENGHTHHPRSVDFNTRMMLISGSGFPDRAGNFDALQMQFRRLFTKDVPMILCMESPLLSIKEAAPVAEPYLAAVRQAGSEFKATGNISPSTQAILDAPMFPPDEYRRMSSGG